MARRRYFRRRRPVRRRRFINRKYSKFVKKAISGKIYRFKRSVDGATINTGLSRIITQGAGLQHFGFYFTLADVPGSTEFTSLFDQYRINKVVMRFMPMINVNNVQPVAGASVTNPGLMGTVIDHDDVSTLATITDYEQYQTWKCQPAISLRTHTRVIRPRIAVGAYAGAFTSYANTKGWIDCGSPNVQHYGLKFYMDAYGNANAAQTYQVMATYYLSFRDVR